jgi:Fe-S cluster biogenesis protein NfuA
MVPARQASPLLFSCSLGVRKSASRRSLFVRTHETPNERCLKFVPGQPVLQGLGSETRDFQSPQQALASPLAEDLFKISGVRGVFFSKDFVTVTISDATDWPLVKPEVFSVIMEFFASEKPILAEAADPNAVSSITEEDDEVVAMIKELIDTRIRPAVQADGGDLAFLGFDNGIVQVQLQGACVGCSSSSITLKNGIENMLMHYVPEVEGVENVESEMDEVSNDAFAKLEENLDKIRSQQAK